MVCGDEIDGAVAEALPESLAVFATADGWRAFVKSGAFRDSFGGQENCERLWQGLLDGTIDFIVTDHSPCPPALKRLEEGNFRTAWGGIASLSIALPLLLTEASRRSCDLTHIARWMSEGPAKLAGCHSTKGHLAAGYDADFVVLDTEAEFTVTSDRLHYKHLVSPYMGETLRGIVEATYLRGHCVFERGSFPGEPLGRECRVEERGNMSHVSGGN